MNTNQSDKMHSIMNCARALPAATSVELSEASFIGQEHEGSANNEWLQPLIDGNLSAEEATNKKTIIAKAIIKGVSNGTFEKMTAPDVASLIDEGITRMSVAKQVAQGTMDTIEAMDVFIDHAAARVVTVADAAIIKVENTLSAHSEVMADTLVDSAAIGLKAVASAFPPTRVLVPFIDTVAQFIKPVARTVIKKGISMVANAARVVVKKVVPVIANKVKQAGRAIKNFLTSRF